MDIPYAVEARPDTGRFNAKVGIWLFLASEVMLFGALCSSYLLLRVGADPATLPRGLLNIPLGPFNTTVLITSSITVVMSWASLKMGNFANFREYQAITLLCALSFLGIKSFEYRDKFSHYEIWKTDGSRLTGHLEGKPYFWKTKTLPAMNLASVTFHPDPTHYAFPAHAHRGEGQEGAGAAHGEAIKIPVAEIKRLSAFVPAHSTYFAIYFTLTALHPMHVLGGAIVIGYLLGPVAQIAKTHPDPFTNR